MIHSIARRTVVYREVSLIATCIAISIAIHRVPYFPICPKSFQAILLRELCGLVELFLFAIFCATQKVSCVQSERQNREQKRFSPSEAIVWNLVPLVSCASQNLRFHGKFLGGTRNFSFLPFAWIATHTLADYWFTFSCPTSRQSRERAFMNELCRPRGMSR